MRRISLALALLSAVAAAGCGQSSSGGTTIIQSGGAKHPYFGDPKVHVAEYMKASQTPKPPEAYTCTDCHGANLLGGTGPSCASCHPAPSPTAPFTHPTDGSFGNPALHGVAWISSSATCATCHSSSFAPRCDTCHMLPHPVTYASTPALQAQHAGAYAAGGRCTDCHGATLGGATAPLHAPACASCHNDTTAPSFGAGGPAAFLSTHGSLDLIIPTTSIPTHANNYFDYAQGVAGALDCTSCHGATLAGGPVAPACSTCHKLVGVPSRSDWASSNHNVGQALGGHDSQSCRRCHNGAGFMDYVGADGSQANNLSGSFYPDSPATFFSNSPGSPSSWTLTALRCQSCHNSTIDPLTTAGLTKVLFAGDFAGNFVNNTGSLSSGSVDKAFGICAQCHQSGYSNSGLGTVPAQVEANIVAKVGKGVSYVIVTALKPASVASGTIGLGNYATEGSTTLLTTGVTNLVPSAYSGYTAIFRGEATPALNGVRAAVSTNDASTVTLTAATALPAAPRSGSLWAATNSAPSLTVVGTASSTSITRASGTWTAGNQVGLLVYFYNGACAGTYSGPVTANTTTALTLTTTCVPNPGDGLLFSSIVADSAVLYPTATGGSTTTLVDSNRSWDPTGTGQWTGYLVRLLSGANAGLASHITASDATSITFGALPAPVAAGDLYEIASDSATELDANAGVTNVSAHRLEAASTLYGSAAGSWYQYAGKTYVATFTHGATATANGSCITCHNPHTLEIKLATCQGCHGTSASAAVDPDGIVTTWSTPAGSSTWTATPFNAKQDVDVLASALAATLQSKGVCFPSQAIGGTAVTPYSYSGTCSTTTKASLTPRLLRASFNYGAYLQGDPGAWAHNPDYVKQVLYDSITDLGGTPPGTVSVLNRP
jgi:hypothetical protein